MKRRLFLLSGSASATALALSACGGGGGGADGIDTTPTGSIVSDTRPPGSVLSETPTQPANQSDSALASKLLGCYYTAWDGSHAITSVPTDFNVIYLFNAQNGGTNTGDGSWHWPFASTVSAAQVQQVRKRGQKVVLTVGGAGLGYSYTNRTQSTRCVDSIRSIIDSLGGVDGVDFNNYEAGIGTSLGEMVWIAQQLVATYGPGFMITSPPAPTSTGGGPVNGIAMGAPADLNVMGALADAGVLTYAAPQFYDWSFYNGPGVISSIAEQWIARLGADKVVLGLSANYPNGPSLADCIREYEAVRTKHPNIRGAYCWSAQNNMAAGNVWGSTMRSLL